MASRAGSESGRALRRDAISAADERRFWRLVEHTADCWLWRPADRGQYGQFRLRDARMHCAAHRVSAALAYGDLPEGEVVLHSCDEPSCVRPEHLSVGTQKENVLDCLAKGRHGHRLSRAV